MCPYPSLRFFFYCSAAHRDLHSFPTRRSSDLVLLVQRHGDLQKLEADRLRVRLPGRPPPGRDGRSLSRDRKSTRLNSSHRCISYAVFCLKKKKKNTI